MIKYKALVIVLLVAISNSLLSQDYIYKKDGKVIPVEIVNSNQMIVTFKIYNDPNSYKQKIHWSEIDSIVFQDDIVRKQNHLQYHSEIYNTDFDRSAVGLKYAKPNIFYIDLFDLAMFNNIGVGYEHMFVPKLTSLSFNFSKSFISKSIEWPYFYEIFTYPKYGYRFGANLYFVNSGSFNYGLSLIYNITVFDEVKIDYYNGFDSYLKEDVSTFKNLGTSIFFRFHLSEYMTSKLGLDLYFNSYTKSSGFFLIPHISIGINF
jgi:hypothetical protein